MPTRLPLTTEQRRAAATPSSRAFIVAVPGSGKTTVAVERYGVIRFGRALAGRRVLGLSFARSATFELSRRVQRRWGREALALPHGVITLDALHREIVHHLLREGVVRWPGEHTELRVLDTWRGQHGSRPMFPNQGFRRKLALHGSEVTSIGIPVRRPFYGIGGKDNFEHHLREGLCTHDEIRSVVQAALQRDDLRPSVSEYLRTTASAIVADEIFDANGLDLDIVLVAIEEGIPTTLIGDPWQALYEFRGAEPELVPRLVAQEGFDTFPISRSFRYLSPEMADLAVLLREGTGTRLQEGKVSESDVVLASTWDALWAIDDAVLPLSFGRIDNLTDAAIVLLLDQLVTAQFGVRAIFINEAITLLELDTDVLIQEGRSALWPVLETLAAGQHDSAGLALGQLRRALKELGTPRQLRRLPRASEDDQIGRLEDLARRLRHPGSLVAGMTIHQAKGREWDSVGVHLSAAQKKHLTEGLVETDMDDRAVYVALTRARYTTRLV